jgi:hypothetical protein
MSKQKKQVRILASVSGADGLVGAAYAIVAFDKDTLAKCIGRIKKVAAAKNGDEPEIHSHTFNDYSMASYYEDLEDTLPSLADAEELSSEGQASISDKAFKKIEAVVEQDEQVKHLRTEVDRVEAKCDRIVFKAYDKYSEDEYATYSIYLSALEALAKKLG